MKTALALIFAALVALIIGLPAMVFVMLLLGSFMVWAWVEDAQIQRQYDEQINRIERGEDI